MNAMLEWLNGKKTFLGLVAKALLKLVGQVNPEFQGAADTLDGYVDLWIGVGVAHKLDKMGE